MSTPRTAHLYGIDPGSSKPWAGYCCSFDLCKSQLIGTPAFRSWSRHQLVGLVDEMKSKVNDESVVLVSLDVPISMPISFAPDYFSSSSRQYPFNVEPFTIRPCEASLRSRPSIIDENLEHIELIGAIGQLCGWVRPFRGRMNTPFQSMESCEGISVMIYSEAPHQPITRVFLEHAARAISDESLIISPSKKETLKPSRIYVMESHPAVSMGFWAIDGALGENFLSMPRYKGTLKGDKYKDMSSEEKATLLATRLSSLMEAIAC